MIYDTVLKLTEVYQLSGKTKWVSQISIKLTTSKYELDPHCHPHPPNSSLFLWDTHKNMQREFIAAIMINGFNKVPI